MASIADTYVQLLPQLSKSAVAKELAKIKDVKVKVNPQVVARQVQTEFNKIRNVQVKVDAKANYRQVAEEFGRFKNVKVKVDAKADLRQLKEEFDRSKGIKVNVGTDARGIKKDVEREAKKHKSEVPVELSVDQIAARNQIRKMQSDIGRVLGKIGVDVDKRKALEQLRELHAQGERLLRDMRVSVDTTEFKDQLERLRTKIDISTEIEVDRNHLARIGAQIATALSSSALKTTGDIVKQSVGFIGDTLEKVARVHPILTISTVVVGGALLVEATGIAASLSGALALIPGVAAAAGAGMGVLALATQGFSDALKEMGDPEKFAAALQNLSPAAQQAALAIQSIMDTAIKPLQQQLSEAWFANVGPQLVNIINAILPAIQPGLVAIADAFNQMFMHVSALFQDPVFVSTLQGLVANISAAFQALAPALAPFIEAMGRIAAVGSGFLPELATGLTNLAFAFADFIEKAQANGSLQDFIQRALDSFRELWPLIPALVDAFYALAPIAESLLPSMVTTLQLLIQTIPGISGVLVALGPNFHMIAAGVDLARTAFGFLHSVMSAIKIILDEVGGVATALAGTLTSVLGGSANIVATEFETHFPRLSAAVHGAEIAIAPIVARIKAHFEALIAPLKWLLDHIPFLDRTVSGTPTMPGVVPPPSVGPGQPTLGGLPGAQAARRGGPSAPSPLFPAPQPGPVPSTPPGGFPVPAPPPPKAAPGGGGGAAGTPKGPQVVPGSGYTGFGEPDWEAIAQGESGGNWQAVDKTNTYFGGLQITRQSWVGNGGPAGTTANMFSKADQIAVAENILQSQGPGAWPNTFKWRSAGSGSGSGGASGAGSGFNTTSGLGQTFPQSRFSDVGLQPNAARLNDVVAALFPDVTSIGGYEKRPAGTPQMHTMGRALDINVPNWQTEQGKSFGDQINTFLRENAEALGVESTIWRDIWKDFKGNQSIEKGHQNHIHVQVKAGPAAAGPVTTDMQQWPGYDGPGLNRDNPMYVQPAKEETGGEQLGKDILSGIGEVFGFGDIFKDPTQFGLFKIFKAFMGLTTKEGGGQGQGQGGIPGLLSSLIPRPGQQLGTSHAGGPAQLPGQFTRGGGGGDIGSILSSVIPQPFGQLNTAGQTNAPGQFQPLMPQPGGGGVVLPGNIMASPFSPTGPGAVAGPGNAPVTYDQKTIFNGPVGNIREQTDAWQGADGARFRQNIKHAGK